MVKNWVCPNLVIEVRSTFVVLSSYNGWFVKDFASIATYLTRLTQRDVSFECTDKCEKIFQKLKTLLTTTPILTLLVEDKHFVVYYDTLLMSLGDVLMQEKNVIANASHHLKVHQQNYPMDDLEFATMVFALNNNNIISVVLNVICSQIITVYNLCSLKKTQI